MKFLYVNIQNKSWYRGHKKFDIEWCKNLSSFGMVDLIQPEPNWYNNCPSHINLLTFEISKHYKKTDFILAFLLKLFKLCKTINPSNYANNKAILNYVKKLDSINHYDAIIAARFDIVTFVFILSRIKKRMLRKMYIIEHLGFHIKNHTLKTIYYKKANLTNHIVMDHPIMLYFKNTLHIKNNHLFYIPHPFNEVIHSYAPIELYDIVGISNTNSIDKINEIIEYEKKTRFFTNNKIKVLLRNTSLEYDDGFLKVTKGWVNYTVQEYYSLIARSKIILLPFSTSSQICTSGTIIDALSYRIPCIGTPFKVFLSYCQEYPNVCWTYNNIYELINKIVCFLSSSNNHDMSIDFDNFYKDRTGVNYINYIKKLPVFDKMES